MAIVGIILFVLSLIVLAAPIVVGYGLSDTSRELFLWLVDRVHWLVGVGAAGGLVGITLFLVGVRRLDPNG